LPDASGRLLYCRSLVKWRARGASAQDERRRGAQRRQRERRAAARPHVAAAVLHTPGCRIVNADDDTG
jgi:hypothetical protein